MFALRCESGQRDAEVARDAPVGLLVLEDLGPEADLRPDDLLAVLDARLPERLVGRVDEVGELPADPFVAGVHVGDHVGRFRLGRDGVVPGSSTGGILANGTSTPPALFSIAILSAFSTLAAFSALVGRLDHRGRLDHCGRLDHGSAAAVDPLGGRLHLGGGATAGDHDRGEQRGQAAEPGRDGGGTQLRGLPDPMHGYTSQVRCRTSETGTIIRQSEQGVNAPTGADIGADRTAETSP